MEDIKIIIDTNAEQAGRSFDDLSKKFKNADNSAKDLRKEIKELKNELFTLTPGTEEYSRVLQELGIKMDELQETTQQLRAATGGLDTVFQTTTSAVGSLAAGFTAANGVVALFGGDTEDLAKTFVKLQAVMAIMTGLKGFAAFTKESKKAWISLKTFTSQSLLATKATIQQTTATSTLSATQKVATISTNLLKNAFKSLTAAMASNPFGAVLVALTALVSVMSKVNAEAKKAAESQKEYNESIQSLNNIKLNTYTSVDDYYQHQQINFKDAHEFYEYEKNQQEIRINRLKTLGATEEQIASVRKHATEEQIRIMEQSLKLLDDEIDRLEDMDKTVESLSLTGQSAFHNFGDGSKSLEELRTTANQTRKDLEELYGVLNQLTLSEMPESFTKLNDQLKDLGNRYKIDIAGGLKTQGDYLQAQIKAYKDAIDDLYNTPFAAGTPKEFAERADMKAIYEGKIKELEVELEVYNAGLRKKAADEAKKAAEALNKNFKKLSTDISNKADEYKEAWEKTLKNFAEIGTYTEADLVNGNQSIGRAFTELNRYSMQLDEYCKEWLKSADKALKAGEITQAQYSKLVKYVDQTRDSMVSSMRSSMGTFISDDLLKAGKEIQDIVEGFKKQNDNMLAALAGGLVTKEEYASFLEKRVQEYKQEVDEKMPAAMEEINNAIAEAIEKGEDTTGLEEIYKSFLDISGNVIPPSVVQQINTALKEMIDKEFQTVADEYSDKMSVLEKEIHDATYGWLYGSDGNIKSGDSLVMKLLFGNGENPKKAYDTAREQAEKIFNAMKEEADEEIKLLQGRMELLDKNSDQYQEYADKIKQIMQGLTEAQQDMEDKQIAAAEEYANKIYAIADGGLSGLSSLAGAMGAYYQEQAENAKEMYGENSEEYKKYLKKEGNMKIAQVWTDAATGIMAAWATSEELGPIAGPILAAIQTATLLATATASTMQIKRQTNANASGGETNANVGQLTDRVIMAEAQNTDQTAQLNASYNQGATRVFVTVDDINNGQNANRTAVTNNTF